MNPTRGKLLFARAGSPSIQCVAKVAAKKIAQHVGSQGGAISAASCIDTALAIVDYFQSLVASSRRNLRLC